jgi:hypothetical protein
MNARRLATCLAAGGALLTQPVAAAVAVPTNALVRTVSASRQFVACANNRLLSSALCAYAERVKRGWLRQLDMLDNWRDPILLLVQTRQAGDSAQLPVSKAVIQTDEHLEYRIRCLTPPPIQERELLSALVDALCSEWANREQATSRDQAYSVSGIPLWLVEGLAALTEGDGEPLLFATKRSIAGGRIQQARDLLDASSLPSDPVDRQLFQADAWMFTNGLLGLHQGPAKLRKFLSELGARNVASNAFWKVYHDDFPDARELEKWWSLELVRYTFISVAENLSVEDTEHDLDAILTTKLGPVRGGKTMAGEVNVAVADLWRYERAPWMKNLLNLKIGRIGALRGVAHPLYLAALDDYMEALVWLQRGSVNRFHRALNRAETARSLIDKQAHGMTAYLDEAERIYAPEQLSSTVRGYFQTLDELQKLDSERRSPISDYLDKFDH